MQTRFNDSVYSIHVFTKGALILIEDFLFIQRSQFLTNSSIALFIPGQ